MHQNIDILNKTYTNFFKILVLFFLFYITLSLSSIIYFCSSIFYVCQQKGKHLNLCLLRIYSQGIEWLMHYVLDKIQPLNNVKINLNLKVCIRSNNPPK
jgi:hypothetical protein